MPTPIEPNLAPGEGYVRAATRGEAGTDEGGRAIPDQRGNPEERQTDFGGGTETRTSPYERAGSERGADDATDAPGERAGWEPQGGQGGPVSGSP